MRRGRTIIRRGQDSRWQFCVKTPARHWEESLRRRRALHHRGPVESSASVTPPTFAPDPPSSRPIRRNDPHPLDREVKTWIAAVDGAMPNLLAVCQASWYWSTASVGDRRGGGASRPSCPGGTSATLGVWMRSVLPPLLSQVVIHCSPSYGLPMVMRHVSPT